MTGLLRLASRVLPARPSPPPAAGGAALAYEPALLPPPALMRTEGIDVLEEWLRWGEEWSVLLRVYARLAADSHVVEIGCGLGRIAFALRYVLSPPARYRGFEICREKVDFLKATFEPAHPNFRFTWADVRNTYYNPAGTLDAAGYTFPYPDDSADVVFAASVLTHMRPEAAARYVAEAARVLRPGGRALLSVFLLDHYEPARRRPSSFARSEFAFDQRTERHGPDFGFVVADNPEQMTAHSLRALDGFTARAGLRRLEPVLPGLWSGVTTRWIGVQDLIVLTKPGGGQ